MRIYYTVLILLAISSCNPSDSDEQSKEDPKDRQETLRESDLHSDARTSDTTDTAIVLPDTTANLSDTTSETPKLILVAKEFEKTEIPDEKTTPDFEVSKEIRLGIGSIKDTIATVSQLLKNDSLFVVSGLIIFSPTTIGLPTCSIFPAGHSLLPKFFPSEGSSVGGGFTQSPSNGSNSLPGAQK